MFPMINTASLRKGLQHWKYLWPSQARDMELAKNFADSDPNRWKTLGFIRHAPEYWLLTSLVLDRVQGRYPQPARDDLPIYDDTDMIQMNGLIAEFKGQKLSISS